MPLDSTSLKCPKCGLVGLATTTDCPGCGIVFARYRGTPRPTASTEKARETQPRTAVGARSDAAFTRTVFARPSIEKFRSLFNTIAKLSVFLICALTATFSPRVLLVCALAGIVALMLMPLTNRRHIPLVAAAGQLSFALLYLPAFFRFGMELTGTRVLAALFLFTGIGWLLFRPSLWWAGFLLAVHSHRALEAASLIVMYTGGGVGIGDLDRAPGADGLGGFLLALIGLSLAQMILVLLVITGDESGWQSTILTFRRLRSRFAEPGEVGVERAPQ